MSRPILTFSLMSTGLLLAGCVPPPCGNYAGGSCYQTPASYNPAQVYQPAPSYPSQAYPAPSYQPDTVYQQAPPPYDPYAAPPGQYIGPDGLTYLDGAPYAVFGGEQVAVIYDPGFGGWGYFDRERHFHGAPPEFRERMERFHPGGRGFQSQGGFRGGTDRGGFRPDNDRRPPPGVRPSFAPPGAPREGGFREGERREGGPPPNFQRGELPPNFQRGGPPPNVARGGPPPNVAPAAPPPGLPPGGFRGGPGGPPRESFRPPQGQPAFARPAPSPAPAAAAPRPSGRQPHEESSTRQ